MRKIAYLIWIGLIAGLVLFYYHLYQLDRYLKSHHEEIWYKFGFGNKRLNILAKFQRLRTLATQYQADDVQLNRRLRTLSILSKLITVGVAVLCIDFLTTAFLET